MNALLARYFNPSIRKQPDGLKQEQREAIIDLLNFCRIADDKLVAEEEVVSASEEAAFNWESRVEIVAYAADSLERATAVKDVPEARKKFLQSISDRLITTETKTRAIGFCLSVFKADGDFSLPEREVFKEISAALGWIR